MLDPGQVFEEHHGANRVAAFVLDLRERITDDAIQIRQPELGAIGQMAQFEGAREYANHCRPLAQHLGKGPAHVGIASGQPEHAVRLVVHQRERAVAFEGDDAVAHTADDLAEKAVVRGSTGAQRRWLGARHAAAADAGERGELGAGRIIGHEDYSV